MAEFTETNKYITLNHHGTPVLAETNTNIIPIGIAHEKGVSEEWLLEQYEMSRAQLHSALAYFYEYRDIVREYEAETQALIEKYDNNQLENLRKRVK